MLTAIQRTNVVDEIVDQLMAYIAERRPGDRIPPERQLVQQLGVSRSSMREALRVLSSLGLLEVREGRGTFVGEGGSPLLNQALMLSAIAGGPTAQELHEVRAHVEPFAARLAAERATPPDLDEMVACLDRQAASLTSIDRFLEADLAFHLAIAGAAGNRFLAQLLRTIRTLNMARMATVLSARGDMRRRYREHRAIYDAIAAGDAAGAAAAMTRHVEVYSRVSLADDEPQRSDDT